MSAAERETSRVDVRSADGTSIAVWVAGEGPPLVLVHGSLCDHTRFDSLLAELGDGVTTFAMDRRGFGASGGAPRYDHRAGEFEDVAAVVDAVADRTGEPVALWGHSYGANCAMGGGRPDRLRPSPPAPPTVFRTRSFGLSNQKNPCSTGRSGAPTWVGAPTLLQDPG
jgi:pimeloyl-ACP methyl ester carboxylesterase